jgi:hypothetical protein
MSKDAPITKYESQAYLTTERFSSAVIAFSRFEHSLEMVVK